MANASERRKFKRFSLIEGMAEPVEVFFPPPFYQGPIVGKIVDISSGGIGMITSEPVPKFFIFSLHIGLSGIPSFDVKGKVVRLENKNSQYYTGISFTEIDGNTAEVLKNIAEDNDKCDKKRAEGQKDFCFEECKFASLCGKKEKLTKLQNAKQTTSKIDLKDVKEQKMAEKNEEKKVSSTEDTEKTVLLPPVPDAKVEKTQILSPEEKPKATPKESVEKTVLLTPAELLSARGAKSKADIVPEKKSSSDNTEKTVLLTPKELSSARGVQSKVGIASEKTASTEDERPVILPPMTTKSVKRKINPVFYVLLVLIFVAIAGFIYKGKIAGFIAAGADKKLSAGNYQEAIKNYKIALMIEPENMNVRVKLAESYAMMKMYNESETEYIKILKINPAMFDALLGFGKLYANLNRNREAIVYLEKAKSASPQDWDTKINLGMCYEKEKKYDKALMEFSGIVAGSKLPDEAYLSIARCLGITGLPKQAIPFMGKTLLPKTATEYFEMGIGKSEKEPEEAIVHFIEALVKKNNFAEAYEWLGLLYKKKNLNDSSVKAYIIASEINPNSARVCFKLAQIYATNKDSANAIAQLGKAISLDTTYVETAKKTAEFSELQKTAEFKKLLKVKKSNVKKK
ncbi:MAG: PilZ domain-containing protein [Elusimicrobia bacterium]|nr:PilZ domain-containing protein [Elusimicrobiota bacterium]